ncbi:hypothetical protein LIER_15649 [Lithospermum erythrorhizon]|uniref:Uncharacterized protein n=1 Tax=Lithospermum erythrorhizon TaxID=34254 RepID=A0AAV3Q581_LITER
MTHPSHGGAWKHFDGWITHGKLACPFCMDEKNSHYLLNGRKVSWFDCHQKFLPRNHPDRKNRVTFRKGKVVIGNVVCEQLSRRDLLRFVRRAHPMEVFGLSYRKVKSNGYSTKHNWTKKSIFYKLPYWKHNLIRHNLDLIQIEKNDLENLLFRLSMSKRRLRTMLSNISRCTMTEGFTALKSHDCHVLIEKLLTVALHHLLPNEIWEAVVDPCHFFRDLCSGILRAINGGPCQYCWMYPFES